MIFGEKPNNTELVNVIGDLAGILPLKQNITIQRF